jgi:hypothetical protein
MTIETENPDKTQRETATVSIDLVPYEMRREGKYWVVKDCAGSILSNLERPDRLGWTENYGDFIGSEFCEISYDPDAEECAFAHDNSDEVVEWISQSFESIVSIGYETLRDLQ